MSDLVSDPERIIQDPVLFQPGWKVRIRLEPFTNKNMMKKKSNVIYITFYKLTAYLL
jgi:hypothetical protein